MFINSHSSIQSFYNSTSNHKIPQYYLSVNNNHSSRNTLETSTIQKSCKRTDSFSPSITIILHALHKQREKVHHRKKLVYKNPSQYQNKISSSSSNESVYLQNKIIQKQITTLSERNGLNVNRHSISKYNQELSVLPSSSRNNKEVHSKQSHRIYKKEKTTSLLNNISDLNHNILAETNDNENIEKFKSHQTCISTVSTQTDNYSSVQIQYQYGNLRRVNSDLLDYMFIR